ncbi:hypothetical protein WA158_001123 [Blastocystis sp. Blastoise]
MNKADAAMRIAKRIAKSGLCSRRDAEKLILDGCVSVNNVIIGSPALNVSLKDVIKVNGNVIADVIQPKVILAYKKDGELVTTKDEQNRPTIFDRLKTIGAPNHIMSVGQLDYHTEGLLLLCNDGDYTRFLEHPSNQIPRRYRVRVHGNVNEKILNYIERGTIVDGYKYDNVKIRIDSQPSSISWLTMQIYEGKYHEIKKILNYYDIDVLRLIRTDFGAYTLSNMKSGEFRQVKTIPLQFVHNIRSWSST